MNGDDLGRLLDEGDGPAVADTLLRLDESARRALAAQIKAAGSATPDQRREGALRVAGAACLPRAAEVVSWLRSARFRHGMPGSTIAAIVRVLSAPGRPSLPKVATALATKLRPAEVRRDEWPLAAALLRAADVPPPATEAIVNGWIRELSSSVPKTLTARLAADPWLGVLLPQVFTIPRVAAGLDDTWPVALLRLVANGRFDRGELIHLVLHRMRAGDRPGAMRPVVELHQLLDPSLDERTEHAQEYLGMLSGPHVAVTEIAQQALRTLDDAGRLDAGAIAEAGAAVLLRTEKKLVRAQLAWLDKAVTRHPEAVGPLLAAVAAGLGNESVDLAEQALRVLASHPGGLDALRERADALDGDLRRQAEEALGLSVGPPAPSFAPAPIAYAPEPMPRPIATVAELADEMAALRRDPWRPVPLERLLAAVARFANSSRDTIAEALAPQAQPGDSPLDALIRALTAPAPHAPAAPDHPLPALASWDHPLPALASPGHPLPAASSPDRPLPRPASPAHQLAAAGSAGRVPPAPQEMVVARIRELAGQVAGGGPVVLLAAPATADGHVDPARVVLRLASAESDGRQPGPYDFAQTLLRLPRKVDPGVAAAADRLVSPAGRRLAAWLRDGGLPDPATTVVAVHGEPPRRTAAFAPPDVKGLTIPDGLLCLPAEDATHRAYGMGRLPEMACWPMVLPGHREIIAAHVQPFLAPAADQGHSGGLDVLPALARSCGPFGPAMALCLAYGLAARRERDRLAVADALLRLAATDGLDAGLIGRELGLLLAAGSVVLGRAVRTLSEVARAGAHHVVWAIARTLVPALLRMDRPPQGAPDLLALAAAAAAATGARADLPEVRAAASRPARTRLRTEAIRLARTIEP